MPRMRAVMMKAALPPESVLQEFGFVGCEMEVRLEDVMEQRVLCDVLCGLELHRECRRRRRTNGHAKEA